MSEAQSDMPEMTNIQEIDSHSQGLPMILMDVVTVSKAMPSTFFLFLFLFFSCFSYSFT